MATVLALTDHSQHAPRELAWTLGLGLHRRTHSKCGGIQRPTAIRRRLALNASAGMDAPSAAVPSAVPAGRIDYARELRRRSTDPCTSTAAEPPLLLLAPMEVLADRAFRRAFASSVGGADEVCQEFIRVPDALPQGACPTKYALGLASHYDPHELPGVSLAPQIMGGDPAMLAALTKALVARGAPRVDLNCGCPAKSVTGKGAGSSLLRHPEHVHACLAAMVAAAEGSGAVVSVKMRAGFHDTALFRDNLLAAQEAGAAFVTLHPRTKMQGYQGLAAWDLIGEAKRTLSIPVVGNGDVTTAEKAMALRAATGCDAIMVGRGVVQDPLVFHRIRRAWGQPAEAGAEERAASEAEAVEGFLRAFAAEVAEQARLRQPRRNRKGHAVQSARLKQVANYLFQSNEGMAAALQQFQRTTVQEATPEQLLETAVELVHAHWGRQPRHVLVNHFSQNKSAFRAPGAPVPQPTAD